MKVLALSFSLLFSCLNIHAQDTTYFKKYGDNCFDIGTKTNGKYNGIVITYCEYSGEGTQLRCKIDYKNGKKDGIGIWYHAISYYSIYKSDGYSIVSYRNDIKEGPCISYDQSGKVERIGQYINDNECGIWYEYYGGKLSRVIEYNNKGEKGQETFFFTDGRISATGLTSEEKVRTGLWIEFDSSTANFSIGEYAFDSWEEQKSDTTYGYEGSKEIGIWKTYNFKGELIKEENYGVKGRRNKSILIK